MSPRSLPLLPFCIRKQMHSQSRHDACISDTRPMLHWSSRSLDRTRPPCPDLWCTPKHWSPASGPHRTTHTCLSQSSGWLYGRVVCYLQRRRESQVTAWKHNMLDVQVIMMLCCWGCWSTFVTKWIAHLGEKWAVSSLGSLIETVWTLPCDFISPGDLQWQTAIKHGDIVLLPYSTVLLKSTPLKTHKLEILNEVTGPIMKPFQPLTLSQPVLSGPCPLQRAQCTFVWIPVPSAHPSFHSYQVSAHPVYSWSLWKPKEKKQLKQHTVLGSSTDSFQVQLQISCLRHKSVQIWNHVYLVPSILVNHTLNLLSVRLKMAQLEILSVFSNNKVTRQFGSTP